MDANVKSLLGNRTETANLVNAAILNVMTTAFTMHNAVQENNSSLIDTIGTSLSSALQYLVTLCLKIVQDSVEGLVLAGALNYILITVFSYVLDILKCVFDELGYLFSDVLDSLIDGVTHALSLLNSLLDKPAEEIVTGLIAVAAVFGPLLFGLVPAIFGSIVDAISSIG